MRRDLDRTWRKFRIVFRTCSKVELCLFDDGGQREIERVELPEFTDEVWHGFLPDARSGPTGWRRHGVICSIQI
jgi:isoamylase